MQYLEKINWELLNEYIENGLITSNKHPDYDIWILNYSPKTQAKNFWDDYTLSCRGLIVDLDGNILARPFQKFKNIEEYDQSEIDMTLDYEIFDKVDGSLIILFFYKKIKKWLFASKGSFASEQASEAYKMMEIHVKHSFPMFNKDYTYLFEIIFQKNRIVVDYGNLRDLILLAVINTKTGIEMDHNFLVKEYSGIFTIIKKHNITIKNLYELKELEEENKEGFVVRFSNGFRVKVKFTEYIRLHGILTNVSNLTVWEYLKNNYDFDALFEKVPDEFYNWLKSTIKILQNDFNEIERKSIKDFLKIYHINNLKERKEFATEALKTNYPSILFKIYDKKSYHDLIWGIIRPTYSKPFSNGYNVLKLSS